MAPIYRREEKMKSCKPKANEPSLIEQLSGPLRDIVNNLKSNVASELEKLRERDSAKYLEFAAKILPLVAALNPGGNEFTAAKDKHSLGVALLRSVGANELDLDDRMITDALNAQDEFIAQLQRIRAHAEGQIQ